MASDVDTSQINFAPVLGALTALHSNVDRSRKEEAHAYLEKFQKSVCDDHEDAHAPSNKK